MDEEPKNATTPGVLSNLVLGMSVHLFPAVLGVACSLGTFCAKGVELIGDAALFSCAEAERGEVPVRLVEIEGFEWAEDVASAGLLSVVGVGSERSVVDLALYC